MNNADQLEQPIITILCSGFALGDYIPALLVNYQLKQYNLKTEVLVLEKYYKLENREKLKQHKKAYHQNFNVALVAHKMTRDIQPSLDENLINNLFERWIQENRFYFIIWSGFWMPIIEKYRQKIAPRSLQVNLCRIDADISASFKIYQNLNKNNQDQEIWLWHGKEKKLIYEIPISQKPIVPYQERNEYFVIHGGGWGIGTYSSKIPELEAQGIQLSIVVYELEEIDLNKKNNRYFMVDPQWCAWEFNQDEQPEFPRFGEIKNLLKLEFKNKQEYHDLYDIIRQSKAIISKPGGSTLIDSLASATPIILLEPYGYAEEKNAEIWEYLGYGISYSKWKQMNYNLEVLEQMHLNILNKPKTIINYPKDYANKINNFSNKL